MERTRKPRSRVSRLHDDGDADGNNFTTVLRRNRERPGSRSLLRSRRFV